MLKRVISFLVLFLYLHGMSGYTMSIHKCMVTGFEKVYTSFGTEDPCEEPEKDCRETSTHFEEADCCDLQQTIVSVDDDSDVSSFKIPLAPQTPVFVPPVIVSVFQSTSLSSYRETFNIRPPDLCSLCIFRI